MSWAFGLYAKRRAAPKASNPQPAEEESLADREMKIFVERVVNTLCPPEKGYSPRLVADVRKLYDVLEGKLDLKEWFTNVKQALSLKPYELAAVLYESLDGLKSEEAKQLREEWRNYMIAQMKGYGLLG